jgi:hypothetical protein
MMSTTPTREKSTHFLGYLAAYLGIMFALYCGGMVIWIITRLIALRLQLYTVISIYSLHTVEALMVLSIYVLSPVLAFMIVRQIVKRQAKPKQNLAQR